jgi:hypothetical protein
MTDNNNNILISFIIKKMTERIIYDNKFINGLAVNGSSSNGGSLTRGNNLIAKTSNQKLSENYQP